MEDVPTETCLGVRSGSTRDGLEELTGFMVADSRGRVVGRVEGPMYGASQHTADAISVRCGFLHRGRRLVPATSIAEIDGRTRVVGLRVDREAIVVFL